MIYDPFTNEQQIELRRRWQEAGCGKMPENDEEGICLSRRMEMVELDYRKELAIEKKTR